MRKPYLPKMPTTWWLRKRAYFLFMLRELTAVFIAAYCVILLVGLAKLKAGPTAYGDFQAALQKPWWVGLHLIALVFAIYHSATSWNALPKLLVIRLGEEQVPPALLVAANYVVWLLVSAVLLWLVFG